jgi:2-methylcitrate dehydratase PrpD
MADNIAWKEYACCAWDHAAMKAAALLQREHGFEPADIAHIRVEAPHTTVRLGTKLPSTTEEAQFNLAWPLAALLVDGHVGPAQVLEDRLGNVAIRSLATRIEVVETEELNALYRLSESGDPRGKYAAVVTITLKDNRSLNSGIVEGNINFPQQGWDADRLENKFRWLAGHVLDSRHVDELVDMVWHFDQVPDVREFARWIA